MTIPSSSRPEPSGPRQGSAVYFEYTNARGELDARCLHAGAPVARGEKWIATKWLRQSAYQQ